jgi:ribosomal protein L37AE/L43A
MNLFNLILVALVGTIVWFIVRAVRQTKAQIDGRLRGVDPRQREAIMRDMAVRIREQAQSTRCPRCGGVTFAMLGSEPWWKCDVCHTEFEGPPHLPAPEGAVESGHPTG